MGISIKNEETERLARVLARETGESLTAAITRALEDLSLIHISEPTRPY